MDIAVQLASDDKIKGKETIRDLKVCKSQSSLTQTKMREEQVAVLPAIEARFTQLRVENMELDTQK